MIAEVGMEGFQTVAMLLRPQLVEPVFTRDLIHFVLLGLQSATRTKTMVPVDSLLAHKIATRKMCKVDISARPAHHLIGTKAHAAQECGVGVDRIGRIEEGMEILTPRTVGDFEANSIVFVSADVGARVLLRQSADEA
jgi:hypothetical protein